MSTDDPSSWLEVPAPVISPQQVADICAAWGFQCASAMALYAERDANFHVKAENGESFLLKIANADSPTDLLKFQNRVLQHLEHHAPDLPVPRVIANRQGQRHMALTLDGINLTVRCMSWLQGSAINLSDAPTASKRAAGTALAKLGRALAACDPAGAPQDLLWDLTNFNNLRSLQTVAGHYGAKAQVGRCFDRFNDVVTETLTQLDTQLIHNDLNSGNVLFDVNRPTRISGIIDFGDMVNAPRICDLAVAAAYQLDDSNDPLAAMLPTVTAFNTEAPLQLDEIKILPDLVTARLVTTLLIQGWRAQSGKDLEGDLDATSAEASNRLKALLARPTKEQQERVFQACQATNA